MARKDQIPYVGIPGIRVPIVPFDVTRKDVSFLSYVKTDLDRFLTMFEYDGFPDQITQRDVELPLLTIGHIGIARTDEIDGGLPWVFDGAFGGAPRRNHMPSMYIVANPTLKKSYNYRIYEDAPETAGEQQYDGDCVVIANDSAYMGIMPIISRYNSLLVENAITMQMIDINCRAAAIFCADDDVTRESARTFIQRLIDGKLDIINDADFFEKIKVAPYASETYARAITSFIEYEQYLKASKWHDLGVDANYNMKREAINSAEAGLNSDALLPFVDDMLRCRQKGVEQINKLFGWNVSVRLSSAWAYTREERDAKLDLIESESEEGSPESDPGETEEGGTDDQKNDN